MQRKNCKLNRDEFSWNPLRISLWCRLDVVCWNIHRLAVLRLERHFLARNSGRLRIPWKFRWLQAVKIVSPSIFPDSDDSRVLRCYSLPGYSRSPHRKGSLYAQMLASLYTASISLITLLYWKKKGNNRHEKRSMWKLNYRELWAKDFNI